MVVLRFTHIHSILDGEAPPEDVKLLKSRCFMAKLRADDDQTSVFRIEKWQITNANIQSITLDFMDHKDFEQ